MDSMDYFSCKNYTVDVSRGDNLNYDEFDKDKDNKTKFIEAVNSDVIKRDMFKNNKLNNLDLSKDCISGYYTNSGGYNVNFKYNDPDGMSRGELKALLVEIVSDGIFDNTMSAHSNEGDGIRPASEIKVNLREITSSNELIHSARRNTLRSIIMILTNYLQSILLIFIGSSNIYQASYATQQWYEYEIFFILLCPFIALALSFELQKDIIPKDLEPVMNHILRIGGHLKPDLKSAVLCKAIFRKLLSILTSLLSPLSVPLSLFSPSAIYFEVDLTFIPTLFAVSTIVVTSGNISAAIANFIAPLIVLNLDNQVGNLMNLSERVVTFGYKESDEDLKKVSGNYFIVMNFVIIVAVLLIVCGIKLERA